MKANWRYHDTDTEKNHNKIFTRNVKENYSSLLKNYTKTHNRTNNNNNKTPQQIYTKNRMCDVGKYAGIFFF